jgi:hypothetical protein
MNKIHVWVKQEPSNANIIQNKFYSKQSGVCHAYPAALFRAREPVLTTSPFGKTACSIKKIYYLYVKLMQDSFGKDGGAYLKINHIISHCSIPTN